MKTLNFKFVAGPVLLALVLPGCATPKISGAVLPMEGGKHQSVIKRQDREGALKTFDHDAKLTCGKPGMIPGKIDEGKYVIVSQDIKETEAKDAKSTGNAIVDKVLEVKLGNRGTAATFEVTTVFKCV